MWDLSCSCCHAFASPSWALTFWNCNPSHKVSFVLLWSWSFVSLNIKKLRQVDKPRTVTSIHLNFFFKLQKQQGIANIYIACVISGAHLGTGPSVEELPFSDGLWVCLWSHFLNCWEIQRDHSTFGAWRSAWSKLGSSISPWSQPWIPALASFNERP